MISQEYNTTATSTSPKLLSSSSVGKRLTISPVPKSQHTVNNGMLDDKDAIPSGVVEKLVNEFQQYRNTCNDTKDPSYGVLDTSTTSPHSRRKSREVASKPSRLSREYHDTSPGPSKRGNNNRHSINNNNINIVDKNNTTNGGQVDVQQQFFKSITNDLIKTGGAVVLKPTATSARPADANPIIQSSEPRSSNARTSYEELSEVNFGNSPRLGHSSSPSTLQLLNGDSKHDAGDEKGALKRQIDRSKTLGPVFLPVSRSTTSPPPTFLSNSAPAQASSMLSTLSKTNPSSTSSSTSSPRPVRILKPSLSTFELKSTQKSKVSTSTTDLTAARAALTPIGANPNAPFKIASTSASKRNSKETVKEGEPPPLPPKPLEFPPPLPPKPSDIATLKSPEIPPPLPPKPGTYNPSLSFDHISSLSLPSSSSSLSSSSLSSSSSSVMSSVSLSSAPASGWTVCKPVANSLTYHGLPGQHRKSRHQHRGISTIGFNRHSGGYNGLVVDLNSGVMRDQDTSNPTSPRSSLGEIPSPRTSPGDYSSSSISPSASPSISPSISPRPWQDSSDRSSPVNGRTTPTSPSISPSPSPTPMAVVRNRNSKNYQRISRGMARSSLTDLLSHSPQSNPPSPGSSPSSFSYLASITTTSSGGPTRSASDPFIPQTEKGEDGAIPKYLQEDMKSKHMLTRSVSALQIYSELDEDNSESRPDLIYTRTRAGAKIVKCGTLNALMEVLTQQKQSDPAFVDAFLLTYPSFTTPTILLEKLIEKYNITAPPGLKSEQQEEFEGDALVIRLRVCSVVKSWVDKYYYDFQKDPNLVERFEQFMESIKERGMEKVSNIILRALTKKLHGSDRRILVVTPVVSVPTPVIPKGEATLLNLDDAEVARQLTLMEYETYCCIHPRECLNQSWNKPNKEEESPNIVNMIRRSNTIPLWVATEIIKEDKLSRRASIVKRFINIAEQCRLMNNFNGVMEIISGLNLSPIYRLRKTWDAVSRKQIGIFEQLNALMAPKGNFKVYRDELHTKDPPCVPFLGRYLTDLTFIEDAGTSYDGEGAMINFVKRMQVSVVIREIQQYQQTPYAFTVVPSIREYLSKVYGFPEAELYSQSRMIEPSN